MEMEIIIKSYVYKETCSNGTTCKETIELETNNINNAIEWLISKSKENDIVHTDYTLHIEGKGKCDDCNCDYKIQKFEMGNIDSIITVLKDLEIKYKKHDCKIYINSMIEKEKKTIEQRLEEIRQSEQKIKTFEELADFLKSLE